MASLTLDELTSKLEKVSKDRDGFKARCPAHEDKTPSLSISQGREGILLHCHAGCSTDAVCAALGITTADLFPEKRHGHSNGKAEIVATYDYTDEGGKLLFQVCRMLPKDFRQRRPDSASIDGWNWSTKGTRKVLYRLPKVLDAVKRGLPVLIAEGEKDVAALEKHGFTATCNPGGAGKWLDEYSEALRGADAVILPDNDEPGRKHAELVAGKLQGIAKRVRVVTLTTGKDAHDFFAAGKDSGDMVALIDASKECGPVRPKPLFELQHRASGEDPDELLRDRYLCRGGGLLLVAPTGIGKSVLLMQMLVSFALGRSCFGIQPARPLSSLLIQAENDEGDLAEMRDGIAQGLRLTPEEIRQVNERVAVHTEDSKTGAELVALADRMLTEQPRDLFALDPALSYLGGESNSQKDVGGFLRNMINPLIHRHGCGFFLVHHGNKPASGKEKPDWQAGDFAYLGAGSAEWANWARAVLAIRSIGSNTVFELRAGKRGARLGWIGDDSERSYSRFIGHSQEPGLIYWREASPDEAPSHGGRPKDYSENDILELLPAEGMTSGEWLAEAGRECGIKERRFYQLVKALRNSDRIIKSKASQKWQPVLNRRKAA